MLRRTRRNAAGEIVPGTIWCAAHFRPFAEAAARSEVSTVEATLLLLRMGRAQGVMEAPTICCAVGEEALEVVFEQAREHGRE
jgi:hypothetical protein